MSEAVKPPKILYKYRGFSPRLLDMLVADELYYSDPGDFNDPLDCRPSLDANLPNEKLEQVLSRLITDIGIDFRIGGNRAYYVPAHDYVMVPPPQTFFEPINWRRTALHEIGHASGAAHRLNRNLSGSFGSKLYSVEEITAELISAFCCASLGIVPTVRHADYIGAWLECLREDNRAIVRAASQASRAADWILSFLPDQDHAASPADIDDEREAA